MAHDDYDSNVTSEKAPKKKAARKVNRKRIGVIRHNRKTKKAENFMDVYVDWPVKQRGEFEFTSGPEASFWLRCGPVGTCWTVLLSPRKRQRGGSIFTPS